MLSPELRQTLLDGLRPEPGERVDAAVATTFTLDLIAALFPPLAFASFALRDVTDPVTAMEAVRGCNQVVDVFCQAGQIGVPAATVDLVAFLEPMVHEVRQPSAGRLFHPKLWLVRYRSAAGVRYRLLCLTRNLTDDHSWDAVVCLDGGPTAHDRPANAPLAALVEALPGMAIRALPPDRTDRVRGLADEVRRVDWERPADIEEILFHVYGVAGVTDRADFSGSRHLIVSPFCTDGGVALVSPGSTQRWLVSRADQLDRLSPTTVDGVTTTHVLSAAAGLPQPGSGGDDTVLGGLHAKVYLVERGARAHLFIGSANATEAAFGGNVELLVELVGRPEAIGIDAVLGPSPSLHDLLDPYEASGGEPVPADEDDAWHLEEALRAAAQLDFTATVVAQGTAFAVHVSCAAGIEVPSGTRFTIELLTRPGEAWAPPPGAPVSHAYPGLSLIEVTPFLVLRADAGPDLRRATVVSARLVGDPAGRHDEILARQIDTTEKFLRFVAALLGLTSGPIALLGVPGLTATASASSWNRSGLFELLVRGLADHPQAIADLDRLVDRLGATERGAGVLPPGFPELWQTVTAALDRLGPSVTTKRTRKAGAR